MSVPYKGQLNLGNAALGSEKTITANESIRTAEARDLAREIHHLNGLIPEQVAEAVLQNFCQAVVDLMNMGFGVQLKNGDDVAVRFIPDVHVKGGNINLARAQELIPGTTDLTAENAAELIDAAGGVTVRVRAIVQQKFTDLLLADGGGKTERIGIETKAYVERKGDGGEGGDDTNQGGGSNGGGNNGGGENEG